MSSNEITDLITLRQINKNEDPRTNDGKIVLRQHKYNDFKFIFVERFVNTLLSLLIDYKH